MELAAIKETLQKNYTTIKDYVNRLHASVDIFEGEPYSVLLWKNPEDATQGYENAQTARIPTLGSKLFLPSGGLDSIVIPIKSKDNGHTIIIGRNNQSDIYLPFTDISKRHAMICFDRGVHTLRDLNSANGTASAQGQIGSEPCVLHDNDLVSFAALNCQYLSATRFKAYVQIASQGFDFFGEEIKY